MRNSKDIKKDLFDNKESIEEALELLQEMEAVDSCKAYDDLQRAIKTKGLKRRLRRVSLVAVSVAAGIVIGVLLPLKLFNDKPIALDPTLFAAGGSKAVLTIGEEEQVSLSESDNESTWESRVDESKLTKKTKSEEVVMLRVETPFGGEYKLRLADGTMVWLNAGTVLEYPDKFVGEKREVRVSGEAFFDVAKNEKQPFVVLTPDDIKLRVLGTRFNVNSYAETHNSAITLVDGSLEVAGEFQKVIIKPKEQLLFNRYDKSVSVHQVPNTGLYTAWMDGFFYYKSVSLDLVLDALNRWYDVEIKYDGKSVASAGKITLKLSREDNLLDILEAIKKVTGLPYSAENDRTIYVGKQ